MSSGRRCLIFPEIFRLQMLRNLCTCNCIEVRTQCYCNLQLTELEEHKRDSARRIDELERACALASKDAQQHESQVLSLQRQLKEAQVSIRNSERETDQVC